MHHFTVNEPRIESMQETVIKTDESSPQPTKRPFFKRWWFWSVLLCLVVGGGFAVWKTGQSPKQSASGKGSKAVSLPTPVFLAPARKGDMNLYLTGLGSVTPLNSVTVRSRVDGQLMTVHFRTGA